MKSPRYWALQQIHVLLQYFAHSKDVEMKSPRYWALQPYIIAFIETIHHCRNEKPETLGIATSFKYVTLPAHIHFP